MKKFLFKTKIGRDLLDDYGHVNNARYLELYEKARWNVFEQTSEGKQILKQKEIGIIILEVQIKFKKEIVLDDQIVIESVCENRGDRIFIINQNMLNPDGDLFSSATFKAALLNLKTRKMVKADPLWIRALGED